MFACACSCLCVCVCACARVCACINPRCFIMIPKEVEDKFFTEAQIFHLQKVKELKYVDRCFFTSTKNLCLTEWKWTVNSMYRCWKGYWRGFLKCDRVFKRKAVGSFCTFLLLILPVMDPVEMWRAADQPTIFFICSRVSLIDHIPSSGTHPL